jgi:hypothetical protein
VILVAGCASPPRSQSGSTATTPQDKAHREQLANMGREDAEAVTASSEKPDADRPETSKRRSGQRVIDQPVRR